MRVTILDQNEKKTILEVPNNNITIEELKKIYNRYSGNKLKYHFKYVGKVLKDNMRLSDYDYEEDDIILSCNLYGGGGPTLDNPGQFYLYP